MKGTASSSSNHSLTASSKTEGANGRNDSRRLIFALRTAFMSARRGSQMIERLPSDCSVEELVDEAELCRRTAQAVAEGKVVGWFQGRMEWGPRANEFETLLSGAERLRGHPR